MTVSISVTIDGPTASGKTTLGMALATTLRTAFFDTGLTFRAISYALGQQPFEPYDGWRKAVEHQPFTWANPVAGAERSERVLFYGEDVTDKIFAPGLERQLGLVAANPLWRDQIRKYHRDVVEANPSIVLVGRDVATDLLSSATLHVALWAGLTVRRERRRAQCRDVVGRSTAVGPATALDVQTLEALRTMPNSIELDSTFLPATAVLRAVLRKIEDVSHGTVRR
jgi:cytidylate kinase